MKLNCLIIDDEPVARKGLEEYVKEVEFLQLAGSFGDAIKASSFLKENPIDLMLLDIQLPKLSGIEFLRTLRNPPMVIFTTAYPEYALEGFSLDVIDYLVKPVPFDRFLKAAQKAYDFHLLRSQPKAEEKPGYFFIKCDQKFEKIHYDELLYVEGLQNYCKLHVASHKHVAYITLSGLESRLPGERFMKVHKSFIVSLEKIKAVEGNEILIGTARIPISRNLKDEVLHRIMGDNLFKRE
jgi:DNA-binding LytR/AlgR family response regulator